MFCIGTVKRLCRNSFERQLAKPMRRKTRQIHVGDLAIGGDAPIAVQSMTTTYTRDVASTVAQIHRLEDVGCELVRVAVPEEEDALAISETKKKIKFPRGRKFPINTHWAWR